MRDSSNDESFSLEIASGFVAEHKFRGLHAPNALKYRSPVLDVAAIAKIDRHERLPITRGEMNHHQVLGIRVRQWLPDSIKNRKNDRIGGDAEC